MTDAGAAFSSQIGWTLGDRTGRYALIVDHGKVVYAENEPGKEVTVSWEIGCGLSRPSLTHYAQVSGAEAVLAKL